MMLKSTPPVRKDPLNNKILVIMSTRNKIEHTNYSTINTTVVCRRTTLHVIVHHTDCYCTYNNIIVLLLSC